MSAIGYLWLAKHSWKPGKQMLLSVKRGSEQSWDWDILTSVFLHPERNTLVVSVEQ